MDPIARDRINPARLVGTMLILVALCTGLSFLSRWDWFQGAIHAGGVLGLLVRDALVFYLNSIGTLLVVATMLLMGLFLCSRFSIMGAADWLDARITDAQQSGQPAGFFGWLAERRRLRAEAADAKRIRQDEERLRKESAREERRLARANARAAREDRQGKDEPVNRPFDQCSRSPSCRKRTAMRTPGLRADLDAMRESILPAGVTPRASTTRDEALPGR